MTELILQRTVLIWRRLDGAWLAIPVIIALVALADAPRLGEIIVFAITALAGTLPYIAVAVLMIAGLKASGAETMIARAFEGREIRMIVAAALIGGLAPFCSCEVIPFVAGLLALGAPLSAIMAFWLSSPLIDPPTLVITAKALGWDFAIGKAVAAVFIGMLGGFVILSLSRAGLFAEALKPRENTGGCCGSSCGAKNKPDHPVWRFWTETDRRQTFGHELSVNALFLLKWLSLAYLLQALLVTYVPAEAIGAAVGGEGLGSIIVGALVGAPAYLNSYVAPAMVAGLMDQGMGVGAAMAFMVAGAVSSLPAMAAVWSLVKARVFAAYLGLGIGGAILFGLLFQGLRPLFL